MTGKNQKKQNEERVGISPVAAAVTGAVIGAGAVVAGVIALKDEKNREKVKDVLTNVKDQAAGYVEVVKNEVQDKKGEVEEKLVEGKEKAKKVMEATKDSLKSN